MKSLKFDYNWCEYLTPCSVHPDIMIGDYECEQCKYFKASNYEPIQRKQPGDYSKYFDIYHGCVDCMNY